ncbi:MAG: phage scaffolding protein [Bacillota bacterium]
MKREFLEGLKLEKDVIDQIMAEHGRDITRLTAERDQYKEQLGAAQAALKNFEGVDVAELKGQISKLTNDLSTKDTEFQQKLADMQFSANLEKAVAGARAKNAKAVMALLDLDALKASKNQDADIAAALAAVKKEAGYLFEAPARVVAPTPGATQNPDDLKNRANEAFRSLFGKGE